MTSSAPTFYPLPSDGSNRWTNQKTASGKPANQETSDRGDGKNGVNTVIADGETNLDLAEGVNNDVR